MSDGEYDDLSRQIDKTVKTGNKTLDNFFTTQFEPDTGMWIHKHPELHKIKAVYERLYK
jgi:predicted small secreted protein